MTNAALSKLVRPPARVYMVEDHPTFRQGMMQILDNQTDFSVCGAAESVEEALPAIAKLKPDLVLVDISLPGKSGLELIKALRIVNKKVKLLVLSMHDEALYANRVLRAGGDGYIMKQEDPEEIVQAVRDVLAGKLYVSEEVLAGRNGGSRNGGSKAKARPLDQLTDAELELLELLGRGKTTREIAPQLKLGISSVTASRAQIRKKLKLKSANALIRYAVCWVETGAN